MLHTCSCLVSQHLPRSPRLSEQCICSNHVRSLHLDIVPSTSHPHTLHHPVPQLLSTAQVAQLGSSLSAVPVRLDVVILGADSDTPVQPIEDLVRAELSASSMYNTFLTGCTTLKNMLCLYQVDAIPLQLACVPLHTGTRLATYAMLPAPCTVLHAFSVEAPAATVTIAASCHAPHAMQVESLNNTARRKRMAHEAAHSAEAAPSVASTVCGTQDDADTECEESRVVYVGPARAAGKTMGDLVDEILQELDMTALESRQVTPGGS